MPLRDILENIVDFYTEVIIMFPQISIEWLKKIIMNVPSSILSDSEKEDFCIDFEYGEDSVFNIHKSFEILSRRAKQVALQGLS